MTMVNHPGLLAAHLDEFAHLEFANSEISGLREAVLSIISDGDGVDAAGLRERLNSGRFAPLIGRLDGQIAACGLWPAMNSASDHDAEQAWLQSLTLQHRKRTLNRELKDAEIDYAREPSDAKFARLVDIQNQLAKSEGTEALIEGFGDSSGRQARVF